MNIILYVKTGCPWCLEMKDFLDQEGFSYQEKNVTDNSEFFAEMKKISGQEKAPTLDVDGKIFADVGVDDVKDFLLSKK